MLTVERRSTLGRRWWWERVGVSGRSAARRDVCADVRVTVQVRVQGFCPALSKIVFASQSAAVCRFEKMWISGREFSPGSFASPSAMMRRRRRTSATRQIRPDWQSCAGKRRTDLDTALAQDAAPTSDRQPWRHHLLLLHSAVVRLLDPFAGHWRSSFLYPFPPPPSIPPPSGATVVNSRATNFTHYSPSSLDGTRCPPGRDAR